MLCTWGKHLTLSSKLVAVQLSGEEHKLATASLSTLGSVFELGNITLWPWERHFMRAIPLLGQIIYPPWWLSLNEDAKCIKFRVGVIE